MHIYKCTVKPCYILKVKNILVNSALYVNEYTIRRLFTIVSHPGTYKSNHSFLFIFSAALKFSVYLDTKASVSA